MFDARRLLDQVMGAIPPGSPGGSGSAEGSGSGGLEQRLREAAAGVQRAAGGADRTQLLTGALAGGVVGLLLGNRRARRMIGGGAGTALKLGGLAAVGALAYAAWQRHQAATTGAAAPPPDEARFLPPPGAPAGQDLARGVLVAMIQGAKADGHIDAEEQRRIFGHLETLGLDPAGKAFVMDELAAPSDVGRVAAHAATPEAAAELYAAALLAMDPDTPEERAWLDRLARVLGLAPGLADEIERTVAASR
jgi:uncharacterized membrane protein YebE (DUF533 family)